MRDVQIGDVLMKRDRRDRCGRMLVYQLEMSRVLQELFISLIYDSQVE